MIITVDTIFILRSCFTFSVVEYICVLQNRSGSMPFILLVIHCLYQIYFIYRILKTVKITCSSNIDATQCIILVLHIQHESIQLQSTILLIARKACFHIQILSSDVVQRYAVNVLNNVLYQCNSNFCSLGPETHTKICLRESGVRQNC